ncbi:MaoC family dehydratase [Cypionkella sinensis]|uniref:MaoC family dehydratase n=1 Tax=Cypionkella sinensis TaxID=1756043 RepID=A0ABV7J5X9_9RHOB
MRDAYLEDISVGQIFGSGRVRVSAENIVRFAQDFDPQPFHLDPALAEHTLFGDLAASGWHTAALTMRLMVDGEFLPAGGIIAAGFDELAWPVPVRAGDELHVTSEILAVRRSQSRTMQGVIKVRNLTINQNGEVVQRAIGNLIVKARSAEP